jgi:hypothetical protein
MANPKPPQRVQVIAARALERRKEHGRGGTEIGVARARDLSNGKGISEDTLKRMVSFFARHAVDDKSDPTSAASIAWGLWGGTAGYEWAKSELARLERERRND